MIETFKIQLVYSPQCQNISEVRKVLRKALLLSGLAVDWKEWKTENPSIPERLKSQAPLSIFLNEKLLLSAEIQIPTVQELSLLLKNKTNQSTQKSWWKPKIPKLNLSLFSAIGILILPKCPLCWAAYMSIFSAFGLSSVEYQAWLLPLMASLLILSVGITLYQAFRRKRFAYMGLIILGLTLMLLGKFILNASLLMYLGIAIFLGAYIRHQLILRNFSFQFLIPQKILSIILQKK